MSDYSYDGNEHHVQLDEDDSASSLTKHLAETAVGVREMSKQLGACATITPVIWTFMGPQAVRACTPTSRMS